MLSFLSGKGGFGFGNAPVEIGDASRKLFVRERRELVVTAREVPLPDELEAPSKGHIGIAFGFVGHASILTQVIGSPF
jgi:hypothetical protein